MSSQPTPQFSKLPRLEETMNPYAECSGYNDLTALAKLKIEPFVCSQKNTFIKANIEKVCLKLWHLLLFSSHLVPLPCPDYHSSQKDLFCGIKK